MARYRVRLKRSVIKEIEAIQRKTDRRRIIEKIGSLADDPRPEGSVKLSGHERYRLRQGPYRILYSIRDDLLVVYVVRVAHRRHVYRK